MPDAVLSTPIPGSDLDVAAGEVARRLCEQANVASDKWATAYLARQGWGMEKRTLEAIAQMVGLTRERVRQVMREIDSARPLRLATLPDAVAEAAMAVDWDAPAAEISVLLGDLGMTENLQQWTPQALVDIMAACGREELASELDRRLAQGALDRKVPKELAKAVREARSGLGVIDLRAVRFQGEWLPNDQTLRAVESVYPVVVSVGEWALCRSKKASSMENAAIQQLSVAQVLTGHEIYQGISRTGRNRNWQVPPESVAIDLLREVGLIEASSVGFRLRDAVPELKFGSIEQWLLDTLQAEEPPALSVDELLRRGRADGLKPASLNVYVTYSAVVRREGGLVFPVGTRLSANAEETLRRAAKAAQVDSDISYEAHPAGVELSITLGTAYLTSGVISAKKKLTALIGDRKRGFVCCPQSHFEGGASLDAKNKASWYGWSPLFNHWVEAHGVEEGQTVKVLMTPGQLQCLESWALSTVTGPPVQRIPDDSAAPTTSVALSSMVAATSTGSLGAQAPVEASRPGAAARPGAVWTAARGHRVLVLSGRHEDLLVPGARGVDPQPLSTLFGDKSREIAKRWLAIRPSGGRVWVDRNGDASTLIDDSLTYLGALPADWSW